MCVACDRGLLAFGRAATTRRSLIVGGLATAAMARPARAAEPETLFVGGTVLTMDATRPRAQALAIADGAITAVGSRAQILARRRPETRVVELDGSALLPGFIDPHMHIATAVFDDWLDLSPFGNRSMAEVTARVTAAVGAAPPGAWVRGARLDPTITPGHAPTTRAELDRLAPDNPLLLLESNGHVAYVNSRALAAAGVTRDTPDPPQGRFVRDAAGEPSGRLEEYPAFAPFMARMPKLDGATLAQRTRALLARASAAGCTSLHDAAVGALNGEGDLDLLSAVAGDAPVRLTGFLVSTHMDRWEARGLKPGGGGDRLRMTGIKAWSDGSNQARSGYQRAPYLGGESRGALNYSPEQLAATVARAQRGGWQVGVHANGDAAIDVTLDAFQAAGAAGDLRHRIEHCSLLHPEQIARMRALRVSPSFLIGHVHYWGRAFQRDILGPARAELLDPCASALRGGLRISLHSDYGVTPLEPLRCIQTAVTRVIRDSGQLLAPAERIPVEAALRAMTLDAAWQCHTDHLVGSLEVGKRADLVVLAQDPTTIDAAGLAELKVTQTWMDGVRRYAA